MACSKPKDVEVPETYSQFADRFVVDYIPSEGRKTEDDEEYANAPSSRRLQSYADTTLVPGAIKTISEKGARPSDDSTSIDEKHCQTFEQQPVTSRESTLAPLRSSLDTRAVLPSPSLTGVGSPNSDPSSQPVCCTCHLTRPAEEKTTPIPHQVPLPPPYSNNESKSASLPP